MIRGSLYLCGSMKALEECERRAKNLEARGYRIVSSWHRRSDAAETRMSYAEIGATDMLEVLRATHVVVCGDTPSTTMGYAVETGLALALGKDLSIIGEWGDRCVFAHVPGVRRYATWGAYLKMLDSEMASYR